MIDIEGNHKRTADDLTGHRKSVLYGVSFEGVGAAAEESPCIYIWPHTGAYQDDHEPSLQLIIRARQKTKYLALKLHVTRAVISIIVFWYYRNALLLIS